MRLIDTHSHVYQPDFDADLDKALERAAQAGIGRILLPNIDLDTLDRMHKLAADYPEYCLPMMGLHPTSVKEDFRQQLETLHAWFFKRSYIAVGEIGIDLYWDATFFKEQQAAFETQLQWSIDFGLPVVIHNREAYEPIMESIYKVGKDRLRGVFHSFGGTREELKGVLRLPHFCVGINGTLTFKNSSLSETLQDCPLERIILETDAPYLAPVPYRGKRNEPAYMLHTAERLATIFRTTPEEIGEQTSRNAERLFALS